MSLTLKDLLRELSVRCDDVVSGIATGGTTTTLVDARLATAFTDDDVFNGGILVINEGGGNMLFASSCENVPPGDFTSATLTDNDCKVYRDKTYKTDGKWSYKFVTGDGVGDQAYVTKTLSAACSTLYVQAHAYAEASYDGAAYIMQVQATGGAPIVSVRLVDGALSVYDHTGAAVLTPTTTAFTTDTWHRIELGVIVSTSAGGIDLWLDEQHIYSGRGLNTGSSNAQVVACGLLSTTAAEPKTIWIDDVKADDAYIGTRAVETEKVITDYAGTTGTLTWSGAIVAPTANSTRYSIYDWPKTWRSRDQKKRAINNAIRTMYPHWYREKVDPPTDHSTSASLTTVRNQCYYELPEDVVTVLNVYIESTGTGIPYWREHNFTVDSSGGVKYLRLPGAAGYETGLDIRLHYMARPVPLVNDNDELNVDEEYLGDAQEYIMAHALSQLWGNSLTPSPADMQLAKMYGDKAEMLRLRRAMPMRVFSMRMPRSGEQLDINDRITKPAAV